MAGSSSILIYVTVIFTFLLAVTFLVLFIIVRRDQLKNTYDGTTGPTGPTGPTGLPGPTGPSGESVESSFELVTLVFNATPGLSYNYTVSNGSFFIFYVGSAPGTNETINISISSPSIATGSVFFITFNNVQDNNPNNPVTVIISGSQFFFTNNNPFSISMVLNPGDNGTTFMFTVGESTGSGNYLLYGNMGTIY